MKQINGKRFTKNAKVVMHFVRAARWIFLGLTVLSVLVALGLFFVPQDVFEVNIDKLDGWRLELSSVLQIDTSVLSPSLTFNIKTILWPFSLLTLIVCGCLSQVFYELQKILRHVIDANPFAIQNGRSLGVIGIYITVFAFLKPVAMFFFYSHMIDVFALKGYHVLYKIDLFLVFVGVMVALLSQLFKYGSFLQTEFDETL